MYRRIKVLACPWSCKLELLQEAVALYRRWKFLACRRSCKLGLLQSAVALYRRIEVCCTAGEIQELVVSKRDPKLCRSMALGYEGIRCAEYLFQWSSRPRIQVLEYCMCCRGRKVQAREEFVPVAPSTKCTGSRQKMVSALN